MVMLTLRRLGKFASRLEKKNAELLLPKWNKDKSRGCLVIDWEYLRN